ncbi:MAG: hypothetical protein ACXV8P_08090 [Methylobacter sp.]
MKKSDYSFVLLSALLITTSAFAESPMFAATPATTTAPVTTINPAITTTPMTTTNPTSDLFSASPAATISPVTTATPFDTTTQVTTTSPTTTTTSSMFAETPTTPINPVVTAGPAFEVSITGIGPAVDIAASDTVRQVIGHAVANGVIERFIVLGHGVEGGFSACAEAAPTGQVENLNAVINQLNTIRPNPQTTAYSVTPVEACSNETVFCTQDVFQCSSGSFVGRVPPSCQFASCP